MQCSALSSGRMACSPTIVYVVHQLCQRDLAEARRQLGANLHRVDRTATDDSVPGSPDLLIVAGRR